MPFTTEVHLGLPLLLKSSSFIANTYYQEKSQQACTDGHDTDNISVILVARQDSKN